MDGKIVVMLWDNESPVVKKIKEALMESDMKVVDYPDNKIFHLETEDSQVCEN